MFKNKSVLNIHLDWHERIPDWFSEWRQKRPKKRLIKGKCHEFDI